jgi:hypothetical protein
MAIAIEPYTESLVPAVAAFNQRLDAGGVPHEFRFHESHVPSWLPRVDGRRIYQEFHVAIENGNVRGAYILKFQDFSLGGHILPIAYYHLPVSEGIVDRTYSTVGVQMLRSAMKAHPLLFCLGMGGFDKPLPRMLSAMGWQMFAVPFFYRVCHPARFLRNIAALRRTWFRRIVAGGAALTGLGWLSLTAIQAARSHVKDRKVASDGIEEFGAWSDQLWRQHHARYAMVGARDRDTLNVLYRRDQFLRLRIVRGGDTLGWAVLLDTPMRANKYFGNLRVGSIVDCFASPEHAAAVVQEATAALERRQVDLVISNQSHAAWTRALQHHGFLQGPSNFIFAASRLLGERLEPFQTVRDRVHLTRGDGDGPVNL